uniref:Growth hormone-inducible transmembrane protein n=1 Tax=Amphimedon queenslandica TaxID=400682 RepID=A0A1X7SQL6_AMPQE
LYHWSPLVKMRSSIKSGKHRSSFSRFWPAEIRSRINKTYTYFAGGLGVTAAAAYTASRSESFLRFMITRPLMSGIVFLVGTIGSAMMCYGIPYKPETIPVKIASYALFTGIMGATLAPIAFMGGPLVARAALYTAGVVGGLSATAACAPSQKYLSMSGPLSLGLGVVFVASIGKGMYSF